mgnify:CR=1 FL=1
MATMVPFVCHQCGKEGKKASGHANRSAAIGAPLYCNRTCAGLGRRLKNPPTPEQKRAAKFEYDRKRRETLRDVLKPKRAAYYQSIKERDREKHAAYRKANMPRHVEYCRRPEYKAKKAVKDRVWRARKKYGEFAEAALVLLDIEDEISSRATRYEVYRANGTLNKAQERRRSL